MTMPNFLVIGAAKSGTTSLYYYLKGHPQIYMSAMKEPKFFAFEGENPNFQGPGDREEINSKCITDIDSFQALFQGVEDEKAIGEASSLYLYLPKAPPRIKHHIPEAKLIAVLRNPVARAYSSYLHCVRDRGEPLEDFAQALQEEERRIENGWGPLWHYKRAGFYSDQLERYFNAFDRSQIKIYLYEDLKFDTLRMLQDIFQFLKVDDAYAPNASLKHNVSGIPKNRLLHELLNKPNPVKSAFKLFLPTEARRSFNRHVTARNLDKPPLSSEVQERLARAYTEDILKTQELIERDLSSWLK